MGCSQTWSSKFQVPFTSNVPDIKALTFLSFPSVYYTTEVMNPAAYSWDSPPFYFLNAIIPSLWEYTFPRSLKSFFSPTSKTISVCPTCGSLGPVTTLTSGSLSSVCLASLQTCRHVCTAEEQQPRHWSSSHWDTVVSDLLWSWSLGLKRQGINENWAMAVVQILSLPMCPSSCL